MAKRPDPLNNKALKRILFLSFGVAIFAFMFWYVNKYIYRFQAAYPIANLVITPAATSVNMSQDSNFVIAFNINGQKVTAIELYIDYDPTYVEYFKEYATGTGFAEVKASTAQSYFDVPLIEEVTSVNATTKRLRLVLISQFDDKTNPNWTTNATGSLKFRAKQAGTSAITINKSMTALAGITGAGEATYFDLPTTDIKTTITASGTGATTSATPGVTIPDTITPTGLVSVTPTVTGTLSQAPTATRTPTATRVPTATRAPTGGTTTVAPTGSAGGYQDVTLNFKVRFQGMASAQPSDSSIRTLPVSIALLGDNRSAQNNLGIGTLEFRSQSDGTWTSSVTARIDTTRRWNLFVKGPKHLRKRICSNTPQEPIPGGYQCPTELSVGGSLYQMVFRPGANSVDLSNILLLSGDIPIQNGIIDSVDIAFIRQNLGNQDQAAKARGDLNYDGIIDAQDYSLILASLAFKYDEE